MIKIVYRILMIDQNMKIKEYSQWVLNFFEIFYSFHEIAFIVPFVFFEKLFDISCINVEENIIKCLILILMLNISVFKTVRNISIIYLSN
jgi:hypothetical protein